MPLTLDPLAIKLQSRIMLLKRPSLNSDIRSHVLVIVFGFFCESEVEGLQKACEQSDVIPANIYGSFESPGAVHIVTRGFQFPDDRIENAGSRQFLGMGNRPLSMYHVYVLRHWVRQCDVEGADREGRRVVHVEARLPQNLADFVALQSRLLRMNEEGEGRSGVVVSDKADTCTDGVMEWCRNRVGMRVALQYLYRLWNTCLRCSC